MMGMAALRIPHSHGRLVERLPAVRGRYSENAALAPFTWFRVGGRAEVLFRPADADDLVRFLGQLPVDIPLAVIGAASNILVRDGGIPGVTVRLGPALAGIEFGVDRVRAGAAMPSGMVARAALQEGRVGLAFLSGIPGTIGGGLRMNAGAYGREFVDVVIESEFATRAGNRRRVPVADMGMGYRHCSLDEDGIFLAATLRAEPGDPGQIARDMAAVQQAREQSQPIHSRTGGSTFRNPPGHRAWELIEQAGCRGLRIGGAEVSRQHCNFLINTGTATAADLEQLGEEVRRRVHDTTGVVLDWEIRRLGVPGEISP